MHAFRRDGYDGVSVKALERTTGVSVGSLYNSFGGKAGLFARAVEHYNLTVTGRRVERYLRRRAPADGLRAFFHSLLRERGGTADGCLLTNTAVEFGDTEFAARELVQAGLQIVEAGLAEVVERLAAEPDAPASLLDPAARRHIASRLAVLYQGVLVLMRFGRSARRLEAFIDREIDLLLGERQ